MSSQKAYWWEDDPEERFWMEIVARPDFGDWIAAPYERGNTKSDRPEYAAVDMVRGGDVVLHWVTSKHQYGPAFMGHSRVAGPPFTVDEVKYEDADPRPGRAALLQNYTTFPKPVGRNLLLERKEEVLSLRNSIQAYIDTRKTALRKSPLFPFMKYGDGRDIRAQMGGYLSKFPKALFDTFPELRTALEHGDATSKLMVAAETKGGTAIETRHDRRRALEGGELGDAPFRQAIEAQAILQARRHYEADNSQVTDVGPSRFFDLLVTSNAGDHLRQVIVRGSSARVQDIELSAAAVDGLQAAPTDLILVHGISCTRAGGRVIASEGELEVRKGWRPPISSLVPVHYRHTLTWIGR